MTVSKEQLQRISEMINGKLKRGFLNEASTDLCLPNGIPVLSVTDSSSKSQNVTIEAHDAETIDVSHHITLYDPTVRFIPEGSDNSQSRIKPERALFTDDLHAVTLNERGLVRVVRLQKQVP